MSDPYADIAAPVSSADPYAGIGSVEPPRTVKAYTTGKNGKRVEFDVPEGADDDTIHRLAFAATRDPRHKTAIVERDADQGITVRPEKTTANYIGMGVRSALEGIGGLGDFAVNSATGLPSGWQKLATFGADQMGLSRPDTEGQELAAAAVRGGVPAALTGGSGAVPALLAGASGAASGVAGEYVRQKGGGPVAQTAAALGAGVLVPTAAAGFNQGARSLATLASREGAKDSAGATLRQFATGATESVADRARYAPTPVSGAMPTLAEVTRDPGLAGLQRGHANTNATAGAAIVERAQSNALARTQAASEALGPGNPQRLQDIGRQQVDAGTASTEALRARASLDTDRRIAADVAAAQEASTTARGNATTALGSIGSTADRTATSQAARTAFDDAYGTTKATVREAYADPALAAHTPVVIPREVFQKISKSADDFYGDGGGIMPPELQSIIADLADPTATTRTLSNLDRRLADFAGQAGMAGRRSEAAFANRVRAELGQATDSLATPEFRTAAEAARAARSNQGKVFETGDAATAFANDRFGNPTVGDTALPGRLMRPGAPGGDTASGLIAAVGQDAAEQVARQEFRRLAEAATTPQQAASLVQKYAESLNRFPGLQRDAASWASSVGRAEEAAAASRIAPKPTPDETAAMAAVSPQETAITGTPLARVADASVEPSSYVAQLLGRQDGGRELTRLAGQISGDKEAISGARRSFAEFIEKQGVGNGRGPVTASGDAVPGINPTRQAVKTVLERGGNLLTSQQRAVLRGVEKELEGANFAATAGRPAGSDTAMNSNISGVIGRRILGAAGTTGKVLDWALSHFGNGDEVKKLLTEAVLDPKFAAELLMRQSPQRLRAVTSRLQSSAIATGTAMSGQLGQ